MRKNNPFGQNFDPFDALQELNQRLLAVEKAHNIMAEDYIKTQRELSIALDCLNSLQKSHLALSEVVGAAALQKWDIDPSEIYGKSKVK